MRQSHWQIVSSFLLIFHQILGTLDISFFEGNESQFDTFAWVTLALKLMQLSLTLCQRYVQILSDQKQQSRLFLLAFHSITLTDVFLSTNQKTDLVCLTIIRVLQYKEFILVYSDIPEQTTIRYMRTLYILSTLTIYTIALQTRDHLVVQRSVVFPVLTICLVLYEGDKQLKAKEKFESQQSDTDKYSGSNKQGSPDRCAMFQIYIYQNRSQSSPKTKAEQKPSNFKKHIQDYDDIALRDFVDISDQLTENLDTGLILFDRTMKKLYENQQFQINSFEAKAPKDLLELRILKVDKASQKLLQRLEGKSTSSAYTNKKNNPAQSVFFSNLSFQYDQQQQPEENSKRLGGIIHDILNIHDKALLRGKSIVILETDPPLIGMSLTMKIMSNGYDESFCLVQLTSQAERDAYQQRIHSFKIMRQLFMSFSHEFGTSSNYISALIQIADQDSKVPNNLRQTYFTPIKTACHMMELKVSDMLDYNRILGKEFSLGLAPIDLYGMINLLTEMYRFTIEHKKLKLVFDTSGVNFIPEFSSDQQRLLQVLVNLVGNAQKFTQAGQITISVQDLVINNFNYIKISVQDTGIGMDEGEQKRLMNLLEHRIKGTDKISSHSVGIGLGLLISNEIALQLSQLTYSSGGGINFYSQAGKGSTFYIFVKNNHAQISNEVVTSSHEQAIIQVNKKSVFDQRSQLIKIYTSVRYENHDDRKDIMKSTYLDYYFNKMKVNKICESNKNLDSIISERDSVVSELSKQEQNNKNVYLFSPNMTNRSNIGTPIHKFTPLISPQTVKVQDFNCSCKNILVVDDEPINILALILLLKRFSLKCDSATNGQDCLNMVQQKSENDCGCQKKSYDLILMDINMPIIDGIKATQKIRKLPIVQPTICAVTAFVDVTSKKDCYSAGMDYFLNKPVQLSELDQVLHYFSIL